MFALTANKVHLRLSARELLTSGSRKIYICQFTFSGDWDGLDKMAVFQAGGIEKSILLNEENECLIPHEVLVKPGAELLVGVYGTKDGDIVMPTILASLGEIRRGTNSAEASQEPTPGVYEQLLQQINKTKTDIGSLEDLQTSDKRNLVAAINEARRTGGGEGGGAVLPPGGTTGQVLAKASNSDNDLTWKDPITYLEVSNEFGGKTVTIGGV